MFERLETVLSRYQYINEELRKIEVINNVQLLKSLSKEQSDLEEVVTVYLKYKKLKQEEENLIELLEDPTMEELAKEEINKLKEEQEKAVNELQVLLLPKDPNDGKNIIVEIRGAAGGDEANIFAGDLFDMYQRYAEKNGWQLEIISSEEGTSGGYSQIEFIIRGKNVYSKLKYESGAHRVQRVPATESQGRVHTSTATVVVMPEMEDVEVEVKESDLKIDVYRSSGAGGQHVNTTDSAVRITHIPTGVVVTCQNERSQLKNKERALKILQSKIYEEQQRQKDASIAGERKSKVGTGDRSEKIRTYNYPQNRITDHRINLTVMQLDRVMEGKLDDIVEALNNEEQRRQLAGE